MPEVARKQLAKLPETDISNISAVPQWFKFTIDYTDLTSGGLSTNITLCTLPIKSWIHAVHWKVTASFSQDGDWDTDQLLQVWIGDEDDIGRWLSASTVLIKTEGSETPTDIEDGIGLIPWEPDFDNTHDLKAQFGVDGQFVGNLGDLDAGSMDFYFLLSSMNGGSAG